MVIFTKDFSAMIKYPIICVLFAALFGAGMPLCGRGVGACMGYYSQAFAKLKNCKKAQELLGNDIFWMFIWFCENRRCLWTSNLDFAC